MGLDQGGYFHKGRGVMLVGNDPTPATGPLVSEYSSTLRAHTHHLFYFLFQVQVAAELSSSAGRGINEF